MLQLIAAYALGLRKMLKVLIAIIALTLIGCTIKVNAFDPRLDTYAEANDENLRAYSVITVSYTHLTLPTICSV